jgi:ADP-heptose:LPS heptosyltransferase
MKSILIIHQGAIGDFVLSLPALEAIHRFHSLARFIFLGHPATLEIIHSRPYFDAVLNCSDKRWAPFYNSKAETPTIESLPPVDSVFAFCRSSSQRLVDNLARVYEKPIYRIDPFPQSAPGIHVSDYQCRQLEEIGVPALPGPPAVIAPSQERFLEANRFVRKNLIPGRQLVLIHPGSGGRKKLWSVAGWFGVISKISSRNDSEIALIEGPADSYLIQQLCSKVGALPLLFVNNWPLGKLAALIKQSSLFLGNDSGITHLAAACNTPTIALFGPTDPSIWGPKGATVKVVTWQTEGSNLGSRRDSESIKTPPPEAELVGKLAWTYLET